MAEPLTIGDALVALVQEGFVRLKPSAGDLIARLRVAARPPEGVTFQSDDGACYTGLVLLDQNKVVMMLAARTEPTIFRQRDGHVRAPLAPRPVSPPHAPPQRSFYEPDEPDDQEWDEPPGYGRFK